MKPKNKVLFITTFLCLLPILLSAVLFKDLPNEVAIHFDIGGNPDGFANKAFAAFGLPLLMAGLNILLQILLENDPKKTNGEPLRFLSKWLIPVLSLTLVPATLFIALGYDIDLQTIIPVFVSILWIIIGNYLPKCKHNYTIGIKIPWTLSSEENWNRTHRVAGWIWTIGGVLSLIASLTGLFTPILFFLVTALMVAVPVGYSFYLFSVMKID
jgi:uncharacterized membrane protein